MTWTCQIFDGNPLTSYAVVFFEAAGFSTEATFDLNMCVNACFVIGPLICFCILPHFGRRTIYMTGLSGMLVIQVIVSATFDTFPTLRLKHSPGTQSIAEKADSVHLDWCYWVQFVPRDSACSWHPIDHLHFGKHNLHGRDLLSDCRRNALGPFTLQDDRDWSVCV